MSPAPQDFGVTIYWQSIPRRDDIDYYEISIYEKDARSKNQTYRTSNRAVNAYTIASNLHSGKLYIAQVRGVAYATDKFEHEGIWSTQQLFLLKGKKDNVFPVSFLDFSVFCLLFACFLFGAHLAYCQCRTNCTK